MRISVYLSFDGQCEEAFRFYEAVLGGRIEAMMPYRGSPMEASTPPERLDKIMHACLFIEGQALMASDSPPEHQEEAKGFHVSLHIDDPVEAERVFEALSDGGAVGMPLQETFWAIRFGMLIDRFGIPWMVNCSRPQ